MEFGRKYWALVIIFGIIVFGFGIANYWASSPLIGFFSGGQVPVQGIGNPDASKVINFYCDYENFYCLKANQLAENIAGGNSDVLFIFKNYPQGNKPFDNAAALASVCAKEQDLFLAIHSKLLENNYDLSDQKIGDIANSINSLDMGKFNTCFESLDAQSLVFADISSAQNLGVESVPAFEFNGKITSGTNMDVIESDLNSWLVN